MHTWQRALTAGILPSMTLDALRRLQRGLADDDPALIHGGVTWPPETTAASRLLPCEGGCLMSYPHIDGTVGQATDAYLTLHQRATSRLGNTYAVSVFTNQWDHGDRAEMRAQALAMVRQEIADRLELTE